MMSIVAPKVLVVEDEVNLAQLLIEYLQASGFQAIPLHHGGDVVPWLNNNHADLIILDLMLPGIDGETLCRTIRQGSSVPIIMATALTEEVNRLSGLELGADDYVCKPYSMREMVARVKASLRRTSMQSEGQFNSLSNSEPKFEINQKCMMILLSGRPLDLTVVEFRLLKQFINNPQVVFTRDDLLNKIYDDYRLVSDRTIDSHIKNVRKKLHVALPDQEVIKSVYGAGYVFLS